MSRNPKERAGRAPRSAVILLTAAAVLIAATAPAAAAGDLPDGFERLAAPDGRGGDWFGYSLAVDGDRVVVGAPFDHVGNQWLGSVWVFTRWGLGWHAERITPEVTWRRIGGVYGGSRFGYSVDIAGDRIVVGAPSAWVHGVESGGVFVFDLVDGEWLETVLDPEGLVPGDGMGWRVDMSEDGTSILAGALKTAPGFHRPGKAFLFESVDGEWQSRVFEPSDGRPFDEFGSAAGLGDGFVVLGAPNHDGGARHAGAVYVYEEREDGEWIETKVVPPGPKPGNRFGWAIGVFGETVVVSTDDPEELFLLEKGPDGWDLVARHPDLDAPPPEEASSPPEDTPTRDRLYVSDFDGKRADLVPGEVVGMWWDGETWVEFDRYRGEDLGEGNGFGTAMTGGGGVLVISAPWHRSETREITGATYVRGMPVGCGPWEPTILGTSGDDEIHGTSGDDVILPGTGRDVIHGSGGRDVYCLEDGGDYLWVGAIGGTRIGDPPMEVLITTPFTARWWGRLPG